MPKRHLPRRVVRRADRSPDRLPAIKSIGRRTVLNHAIRSGGTTWYVVCDARGVSKESMLSADGTTNIWRSSFGSGAMRYGANSGSGRRLATQKEKLLLDAFLEKWRKAKKA